jgi:hypothetical protein
MCLHNCLYCGSPLGLRRFTGAVYCSEAHAQADAEQMNKMMVRRLRVSTGRYRTALQAKEERDREEELARQEQLKLELAKQERTRLALVKFGVTPAVSEEELDERSLDECSEVRTRLSA